MIDIFSIFDVFDIEFFKLIAAGLVFGLVLQTLFIFVAIKLGKLEKTL